jgi:tripartite ATP-independent transporter DctP family solute receptor
MKHTLPIALVLLVVGLMAVPVAAQQATVLRFGHTGGSGSLYELVSAKFTTTVNETLKGKVEIKVTGNSQLGTDMQMLRGLKIGAPEIALISTVIESADPKFGVFEMPYLIESRSQMKKVAENPQIQRAIFDLLPSKGMRVLAVWENGYRHVTNNVRPIEKPEDLRGLKIRVPSGAWWVKLFKLFGASPSPMPLPEVYQSLKTGTVDGQETPLPLILAGKFHEIQKYLSLTGHVYSPAFLLISEETWRKLPKDVQTSMAKIARDMAAFSQVEGERMDRDLLKKLVPPMKLNEVNKDPFVKASAAIYEEFGQQVPGGREFISTIQSLR